MNTNLEFIVALLEPESFAQLYSGSSTHEAAPDTLQLARVMLGRHPDLHFPPAPNLSPSRVAVAAKNAMRQDTMTQGVEELRVLAAEAAPGSPEAVSLTVLYAASVSEWDRFDLAQSSLLAQIAGLDVATTDTERLLKGLLLTQLGLRTQDSGDESFEPAIRALSELETVVGENIAATLSDEVVHQPEIVADKLLQRIRLAAASQVSLLHPLDEQLRLQLSGVRGAPRSSMSGVVAKLSDKYRNWVTEHVANQRQGSKFTQDSLDGFFEVLRFELYGNTSCRGLRRDLAMMRVALAEDVGTGILTDDCIRLVRHSGDDQALSSLLRWFTQNGPLEAIATDARRVAFSRPTEYPLHVVEHRVLEFGADLLSSSECSFGFDRVISKNGSISLPANRPGSMTADSVRFGAAIRSAIALANGARTFEPLLGALTTLLASIDAEDQILQTELTRALPKINWEMVDPGLLDRFVSNVAHLEIWAEIGEALSSLSPGFFKTSADPAAALESVAATSLVFNAMIGGSQAARDLLTGDCARSDSSTVNTIARALGSIREEAARGIYTGYAHDAPDLAAGLIAEVGAERLWHPLVDLLVDPAVWSSTKLSALDRLARSRVPLSEPVRAALTDGVEFLLSPSNHEYELSILPPPPAVRFASSYDLLSHTAIRNYVLTYLSSSKAFVRRQGANCLFTICQDGGSTWSLAAAYQATFDNDGLTRAWAAAAIIVAGEPTNSEVSRVQEMLETDEGVEVPNAILRVAMDANNLHTAWRPLVASIAENHLSSSVRTAAKSALNSYHGLA